MNAYEDIIRRSAMASGQLHLLAKLYKQSSIGIVRDTATTTMLTADNGLEPSTPFDMGVSGRRSHSRGLSRGAEPACRM